MEHSTAESSETPGNEFSELEYGGGSAQDEWARIKKEYDPKENYQNIITKVVAKNFPSDIDQSGFIVDSVRRFSTVYYRNRKYFLHATAELSDRFENASEDIYEKTQTELSALRKIVEKGLDVTGKRGDLKKESDILTESLKGADHDKYDEGDIEDRFTDYMKSLNGFYLDENWQDAQYEKTKHYFPIVKPNLNREHSNFTEKYGVYMPIFKPDFDSNKYINCYKKASKIFQKNMETKIEGKLNVLFSRSDTTASDFKDLKREIEYEYRRIAALDGKGGMIDLIDLYELERLGHPMEDVMDSINTSTSESDIQLLEAAQLSNLDAWEKNVERNTRTFIEGVKNDGFEQKMIKAANKWSEDKGDGTEFDSFRSAKNYFEDIVKDAQEAGPKETLEVFEYFNNIINAEGAAEIQSLQPPAFRNMVYDEFLWLKSRTFYSRSETDTLLVEFVTSDQEYRDSQLRDPITRARLFTAIKSAQESYTDAFDERYADTLDDEDIPPSKDAARLQALILVANQAERIVESYGEKSEYQSEDFSKTLGETEAESLTLALKFVDSRVSRSSPYRSKLFRGGFNGTDLAITGAKILAVMTVIANVANSIKDAEGDNAFEKLINGMEKSATNPAVLAAVGVAGITHLVQMHPELKSFHKLDSYGRKGMWTGVRLKAIGRLVGDRNLTEVKKFTHNESEWKAMKQIDPSEVEDLMDKVHERSRESGQIPIIRKGDLAEYLETDVEGIESGMEDTGVTTIEQPTEDKQSRIRYLFYKKFLSGGDDESRPRHTELRDMCHGA